MQKVRDGAAARVFDCPHQFQYRFNSSRLEDADHRFCQDIQSEGADRCNQNDGQERKRVGVEHIRCQDEYGYQHGGPQPDGRLRCRN
jgi:hypothetical protein